MTLKPLWEDAFPLRSTLSRRAPADVGRDEHLIEVRAELEHRLRAYPPMVDRGTMRRDDMDRHLRIWRAIVADYERDAGRPGADRDSGTWDERVRELRRELALRRQFYPRRIATPTNPLTADDAAKALERLDAVHADYWLNLFRFLPDDAPRWHDARRALWAIDGHLRRITPNWDVARAGTDLACSDPQALRAAIGAADDARAAAAPWQAMRAIAVAMADGRVPGRRPGSRELYDLAQVACDTCSPLIGTRDEWSEQIALVAKWLLDLLADPARFTTALPATMRAPQPELRNIVAPLETQRLAA